MKIEQTMNVAEVQTRMGAEATREEAAAMVELLLATDHADTADIPEGEWLELCERAVREAGNQVEFIEKEQDWQNEATRYWFLVDGEEYAVVESGSEVTIIDEDGRELSPERTARLRPVLIVTDEIRAA